MEYQKKIIEIIADISRKNVSEILITDSFIDDLGFTSLDFADLLNQVELILPIEFATVSETIPYKQMFVGDFNELIKKLLKND